MFNERGTVNVIVDIVGYYEDHNHDDRYVQLGPVTIGQGIDWVNNAGSATTMVGVFENATDFAAPATGGTVQLSLIGPSLIGVSDY